MVALQICAGRALVDDHSAPGLAVRRSRGYLELCDRKEDLVVVSGGGDIPTIEVEQTISERLGR